MVYVIYIHIKYLQYLRIQTVQLTTSMEGLKNNLVIQQLIFSKKFKAEI